MTSKMRSPVNQPTYQEAMARLQPYDRKGKKWKELGDYITYFIAKDCLPVNTVEGAGFRKMVKTFDSRYDIPSCNHISKNSFTKPPCHHEAARN